MVTNFYSDLQNAYSLLDIEEDIGDEFFIDCELDPLESYELFTCAICQKTLKTKRGLEKHVESHSSGKYVQVMDVSCWQKLLNDAINKIIEEDLQSDDILIELRNFSIDSLS